MNKLWALAAIVALYSIPSDAIASNYVDRYGQQVAGTLNIHWEVISGPPGAPVGCSGIEFTDGTLVDAADGSVAMNGIAASSDVCIGLDSYTFTMAPDGLSLTGFASAVPMTLTRQVGEASFVGDWVDAGYVYRAHIAADPFPVPGFNPVMEGEWIGWFDRLPGTDMGTVTLAINDPFFDGSQWSFEGLLEWKGLFGEEVRGTEAVSGFVSSSGEVELAGIGASDTVNWTPGNYIGQRSADGRTMSGTFDGGTWSVTRVSAFSVPTEVTTIQQAVDFFADRPGLRIEIEPGTYPENLDLAALAANPGAVDITGTGSAPQVVMDDGLTTFGPPIVRTNGSANQYPLRLRNLTITGGYVQPTVAGVGGAGLWIDGATRHLFVDSCIVRDNRVERSDGDFFGGGGACVAANNRVRFESCSIQDNTAVNTNPGGGMWGGGIFANGATVQIVDSTLSRNEARSGSGMGVNFGAIRVVDSEFLDNNPGQSGLVGGGIQITFGTADIIRTTFRLNRVLAPSGIGGTGGGVNGASSTLRVVDSVFESNYAERAGGGLRVDAGTTVVTGGRFGARGLGNQTDGFGGAISNSALSFIMTGTHFEENRGDRGGAIYFGHSSSGRFMRIEQATFVGNEAGAGGAIYSQYSSGSITVIDSDFENNLAWFNGGAFFQTVPDFPCCANPLGAIVGCRFFGNRTLGNAGAALAFDFAPFPFDVINSTIANNHAEGAGALAAGLVVFGGTVNLDNSILWGNTGTTGTVESQQLAANPGSAILIEHGIVQGIDPLTTSLGPGPVSGSDPLFVDLAAGDLRLLSGSPAIDAGDAALLPAYQTTDLDGGPRIIGVEVDLGAYESSATPTGVADDGQTPGLRVAGIASTFPNPFNPRVTVSFALDRDVPTRISVHDLRGRLIRMLEDRIVSAGSHSVVWDGTDESRRSVASGAYVIRMEAGAVQDSRVVTLVK